MLKYSDKIYIKVVKLCHQFFHPQTAKPAKSGGKNGEIWQQKRQIFCFLFWCSGPYRYTWTWRHQRQKQQEIGDTNFAVTLP